VVRGPDWSLREQDGGDGYLGTVAEVQVPGQAGGEESSIAEGVGRAPCVVTVQWDCGGRCRYRCGLGGKYDLRGFDSGPAGVVHIGEVCCACGLDPITGIMWKCVRCLEFSICTECYMTGKHVLNHEFDRFVSPRERVRMPARGGCKRREIRGMFKFAEVVPWCDWEPQEGTESGEIGEVVRLCGKNNDDNSRGFVEVEWKESSQKTIHMVGHKGKVELKCVDPSSGGYYYHDHLPLLGAPPAQVDPASVSTGDRVRVELEPELFQAMQEGRGVWNDLMLNVIGKVGTVVGIGESGELKVRYSTENLLCNICAEAVVKVGTPQFKIGDLVRVSSDMEKVRSLQQGHGDWSDAVVLMMGEVGRVYAVYASGDVLVMGKGRSWVFNPLCLSHAADDKEETTEDNPFMKWAKMDVDEGVKFGLTTMLENGRGEALFVATSLGKVDLLRDFLTKYPDMVNFTSDGRTALHYAASTGLAEPMKILLEFHAKIEQQDDTSTRALHTSVYQ
jgi:E3 ubiquitin-protein ligase mind-bomb